MKTVTTSVYIEDLESGATRTVEPDLVLPLASVGKVLLLAEVARGLASGELSRDEVLPVKREDRELGGSGVLHRLIQPAWEVGDLAVLVAMLSDNVATNMLIRRVGLEAVNEGARRAGLEVTRVHDQIRAERDTSTPPHFASGSTGELGRLMGQIARGTLHSPEASHQLHEWMGLCNDRSLVADSVRHDPYDPSGWRVANKTGTDTAVRADVGIVEGRRTVVYSVVSVFPAGAERGAVEQLRRWGREVERETSQLS